LQADQWQPALSGFSADDARLIVRYDGVDYVEMYAEPGRTDLPTVRVRRGGVWLSVVAWLWTVCLIGGIVWSFRYPQNTAPGGFDQ
jgi:hypothetical protein